MARERRVAALAVVSLGSVGALVIWLVASAALAYYASKFGSFNKTWARSRPW